MPALSLQEMHMAGTCCEPSQHMCCTMHQALHVHPFQHEMEYVMWLPILCKTYCSSSAHILS